VSARRRPLTPASRRTFLGLLGSSALLAGCAPSIGSGTAQEPARYREGEYTGPRQRLQFWNPFTGGDGPAMAAMVDAFNAAHPGIEVVMTSLVADDMYTKVMPAVGAGVGPDVAIMHLDQLATFAARNTLVPLEEVVDGLGVDGQDFVPAAWDNGVYGGVRYGIPLDLFTMAQYWSTDALDSAGTPGPVLDAEGYAETVAALQSGGLAHPFWVTPSWQLFVTLLTQFGGRLYNPQGTVAEMGSEAGVQALGWMVEQIDQGVSPGGVTDPRTPFKNGTAALLADLPAAIPDLQLTAPDLGWGVAPFPQIGPQPGMFANSHNFVLTGQSQRDANAAHAAQTFVDWVSRNSAPWIAGGNTPARASVRETEEFRSSPQSALATEGVFEVAAFLPQIPGSREIAANSFQRAVSEAVLGGVEVAEALAFAQQTAQDELDDINELLG